MAEYEEDEDYTEDQYKVSVIAKLLHTIPHYNSTFHNTSATFRPNDENYLESLAILWSVPVALLILSLLGLLIYLITRCCDRKIRPAHSINGLKVALSIMAIMCCAAIGFGFYANGNLHNGVSDSITAVREVDKAVAAVFNQTDILQENLRNRIRPQLVELTDIVDRQETNQKSSSPILLSLNKLQENITRISVTSDIHHPLLRISMAPYLSSGDQWELIRWRFTFIILAVLLVLCGLLLVGVARHSRFALILFSVCGLVAVTASWLMVGLYLSSSVAVGDLCINPSEFIVSSASNYLRQSDVLYYTQCEAGQTNSLIELLRESQTCLANVRSTMATVMNTSFNSSDLRSRLHAINADLNSSKRLLTQLLGMLGCKKIHTHLTTAARGICDDGLLDLALLLITSCITAVLLTIMVWVDSHTWIYIRKRRNYRQVDEPLYIAHASSVNHHQMNAQTLLLPTATKQTKTELAE